MKTTKIAWSLCLAGLTAAATLISWPRQAAAQDTVPVSVIVSVEAKHGKQVPEVRKEDVRVIHDGARSQVLEWVPCQGAQAGLDLFIVIDDATDTDLGSQFDDVRKFIQAQPASTAIGVGYARNGTVQVVQELTNDHARAARALRLPMAAGAEASPYLSVTDLIRHWPESANRREILLVSSGIDFLQGGPQDSYLDESIDRAQRAGVQVYAIYARPIGHLGHSLFRLNQGQSNLSRLTEETGGEFYTQALREPISFGPYLDEYAERLRHQYKLTFLAKASSKPGSHRIRVETEASNVELVAQENVYVGRER